MKTPRTLLALLVAALGLSALAGTPELTASMRRQQQASEAKIVKLWLANQRGEELETALNEYVVRHVRLRAVGGKTDDSLLDAVLADGQEPPENPQALASALVLEHCRRQGIDIADRPFVSGRYHIRRNNGVSAAGKE